MCLTWKFVKHISFIFIEIYNLTTYGIRSNRWKRNNS